MTYIKDFHDSIARAENDIKRELDIVKEVIFWEEEDDDEDELFELPTQVETSRHGFSLFYRIIKVFKDNEGYFAQGIEKENGDTEDFEIGTGALDGVVTLEIADFINSKENE